MTSKKKRSFRGGRSYRGRRANDMSHKLATIERRFRIILRQHHKSLEHKGLCLSQRAQRSPTEPYLSPPFLYALQETVTVIHLCPSPRLIFLSALGFLFPSRSFRPHPICPAHTGPRLTCRSFFRGASLGSIMPEVRGAGEGTTTSLILARFSVVLVQQEVTCLGLDRFSLDRFLLFVYYIRNIASCDRSAAGL